jgi:hypothetical protein
MTLMGYAHGPCCAVSLKLQAHFVTQKPMVTEVETLRDDTDPRVHDLVALDEIELYTEVLSAVAAADRPLTLAELDEVLGLLPSARADVSAN